MLQTCCKHVANNFDECCKSTSRAKVYYCFKTNSYRNIAHLVRRFCTITVHNIFGAALCWRDLLQRKGIEYGFCYDCRAMDTSNKRKAVEDLMSAVSGILPQRPAEEISKNLRAALSGVLERMDLVTREEFEVQQAVLLRSREKLEQLEKLVAELERKLVKK